MTRQEILNILHEKEKRCSAARATYNSAKQAWEEAQQSGESAVSIQHLGALKDTAYAMWQSTEKEIEEFIIIEAHNTLLDVINAIDDFVKES